MQKAGSGDKLHDTHGRAVRCKRAVVGQQDELFGLRLRDERPIERIRVELRQPRAPAMIRSLRERRS